EIGLGGATDVVEHLTQFRRCLFIGNQLGGCHSRSLPFFLPGQLLQRPLPRRLVLAPSNPRGAVAKAVAGDMVITDLDNELGPKRLPVARALGAPAARTAPCIAGKAGRLHEGLVKPGQLGPLGTRNGGGEADMVELALAVVETKQQ